MAQPNDLVIRTHKLGMRSRGMLRSYPGTLGDKRMRLNMKEFHFYE